MNLRSRGEATHEAEPTEQSICTHFTESASSVRHARSDDVTNSVVPITDLSKTLWRQISLRIIGPRELSMLLADYQLVCGVNTTFIAVSAPRAVCIAVSTSSSGNVWVTA